MPRDTRRRDRPDAAGASIRRSSYDSEANRTSKREQLSLKALEAFHDFEQKVTLDVARQAMRQTQHSLELGEAALIDETVREAAALYNADDCSSTRSLRTWLDGCGNRRSRMGTSWHAPTPLTERRRRMLMNVSSGLRR